MRTKDDPEISKLFVGVWSIDKKITIVTASPPISNTPIHAYKIVVDRKSKFRLKFEMQNCSTFPSTNGVRHRLPRRDSHTITYLHPQVYVYVCVTLSVGAPPMPRKAPSRSSPSNSLSRARSV